MRVGQRVQLKAVPHLADAFRLKTRATGTVLCSYTVDRPLYGRNELLDVQLDSHLTLWGVSAEAFEDSLMGTANEQVRPAR